MSDEMRFERVCKQLRGLLYGGLAALLAAPSTLLAQEGTEEGRSGPGGPLPEGAEFLDAFLRLDIGDIAVWRIVVALVLVIAGFALRKFLLRRMLRPVERLLARTETDYDDRFLNSIQRPLSWLINLVALYFAILALDLPSELTRVASLILQTIGTVLAAWMVHNLIEVVVQILDDFAEDTESEVDDYLVPVIGRVLRVGLYALVCVLIVQQWGYDVTSLLAGLGIGGLAFALAAKPTLSNWFGSLMIFTDRPFNIGDRIDIDAGEGIVEEVGLRSTRIRTREDSLLSIPNSDIAGKPIENLSERRERRIELKVGLVYRTTSDQIRQIVDGIESLLDDHGAIDAEQSIVGFMDFGESALEVYVDCYAQTTERAEYFEVREEIHVGIAEIVEEAGSAFAFPSRSLYVENELEYTDRDE